MKCVQILSLREDGSQSVLTTCFLDNGQCRFSGDPVMGKYLDEHGLRCDDAGAYLYPGDGERFLELVSRSFHSGYLMATEVFDCDGT